LPCSAKLPGKTPHGVVRTAVAMFGDQVLVDPDRAEPLLQLRSNDRCERLAGTARSGRQTVIGGCFRLVNRLTVQALQRLRADRRFGPFWIIRPERHLERRRGGDPRVLTEYSGNGLAIDAEGPGDVSPRPASSM